jgi:hypothetical protein
MKIDEEFRESVLRVISIKEPLKDIFEAFIDTHIGNDFIQNIPVVSWGATAISIADKVKTNYLVNKIMLFLQGLSNVNEEEIKDFEKVYLSN